MKNIRLTLSTKSINAAIREVRKYKNALGDKSERLRERIAKEIEREAQAGFSASQYDDLTATGPRKPSVTVHSGPTGNLYAVIADGEEAIFVEFGAGVYYNGAAGSSPHPLGAENGFLIGSYGKGHGKQKAWGYIGEDGDVHITRGTKAQMPLYRATQNVIKKIPQIAKEVFA